MLTLGELRRLFTQELEKEGFAVSQHPAFAHFAGSGSGEKNEGDAIELF